MAIKKRKHIPDPTLVADPTPDDEHAGRSPELQGQRYSVWQFIQMNPRCTREDVSRGLGLKSSTATARIKELIDLGYVVEPPGLRKENRTGVKVKCLVLTDRKAGGTVNDRVRVEVSLTIDCNGVFGAVARVVDGMPQTGIPSAILRKQITLIAPPPAAYTMPDADVALHTVSRLETQLNADQIIDADFEILEVEPKR